MRKIISLLLAVLMLLGVVPTSIFANENLTVSIENKEIYTDSSTVSVDITIANNPGIAIIGFEIDYPTEAFELKSYTNGSIFAEAEIDGNVERTPFMFNAYNGKENKNGNGTLVTLNFDTSFIRLEKKSKINDLKEKAALNFSGGIIIPMRKKKKARKPLKPGLIW